MQIRSNGSIMRLEEMPLDIGYASEKICLIDSAGRSQIIGGQNGKTQLIITTPEIDDTFIEELISISTMLPQGGEYEVTAAVIVANDSHTDPQVDKFDFFVDSDSEFGDEYSVRLVGGPYEGELTKAVILVSKDGAIFYDEFMTDLKEPFNTDTLLLKVMAAQTCYTGKGCH